MRFWYVQNQKIGKIRKFEIFGSKKFKEAKWDSQNRLRLLRPEEG